MMSDRDRSTGWWQQNVLRKFDLVLHHPDGADYDENGCSGCLPCLPCCKRPVYQAGQTITGYLLLRPSRKAAIQGVSVRFRGLYETGWREDNVQWGSFGSFFSEEVKIVENRIINLDYKWYRFDFEYRLPATLPSSFKEPEGKVVYFAFGRVTRPDGPEIETFNSHFDLHGQADIDLLPSALHEPIERRKVKVFAPDQSDATSVGENEALQTEEEDHVYAVCTLNRQAFLVGDSVIADVTIENHAAGCILCMVKFEQVLSFLATMGREEAPSGGAIQYHHETRTHVTDKELVPPWAVKLAPGGTETFSRMFDIPSVLLPSTSYPWAQIPGSWTNQQWDPIIEIKYYIKLVLQPQWDAEELCLPIEVVIGNKDSGCRQPLHVTGEHWDTPPSNGGPPSYAEYFQEEQV